MFLIAAVLLLTPPALAADKDSALVIKQYGKTTVVPMSQDSLEAVQKYTKGQKLRVRTNRPLTYSEEVLEAMDDLENGYCDKRCRKILMEDPAYNAGYLSGKILAD